MRDYKLNIDFQQLRDDKELLISMNITHPYNFDGLINLLDEIQDQAVDVYGIDESVVFGVDFEREVGIDEDMPGEWSEISE